MSQYRLVCALPPGLWCTMLGCARVGTPEVGFPSHTPTQAGQPQTKQYRKQAVHKESSTGRTALRHRAHPPAIHGVHPQAAPICLDAPVGVIEVEQGCDCPVPHPLARRARPGGTTTSRGWCNLVCRGVIVLVCSVVRASTCRLVEVQSQFGCGGVSMQGMLLHAPAVNLLTSPAPPLHCPATQPNPIPSPLPGPFLPKPETSQVVSASRLTIKSPATCPGIWQASGSLALPALAWPTPLLYCCRHPALPAAGPDAA